MYKFTEVDTDKINEFSISNGNFFQTSSWAKFKTHYKNVAFIGIDENGNTALTCLLFLIRVKCTHYKLGYAMRGFVCDLMNKQLVSEFTDFLKLYMKKKHIVYITIDPFESYKTNFTVTEEGQIRHNNLLNLGYIHFNEKAYSIQRPTNYRLSWDKTKKPHELETELFSTMDKKLQSEINIAAKRGLKTVKFISDEINDENIKDFFDLFCVTAKTKDFSLRDFDYYKRFIYSLKKNISIYFDTYEPKDDIEYTENIINGLRSELDKIRTESELSPKKAARCEAKRKELESQLNATTKRLAVSKGTPKMKYIAAYVTINCGTKTHLYFAATAPILRDLKMSTNYWTMIKDCFNGVTESFDMGGTLRLDTEDVKEDKTYDLYLYKSRYKGSIDELLGEYYLINNKILFNILHNKLHYLRRVLFKN